MVNPIPHDGYSHDYRKFVLQESNIPQIQPEAAPKKPFALPPLKKAKKGEKSGEDKEGKKERPPWMK